MRELDFHRRFCPLTSTPGSRDKSYFEVHPIPALAPYVRCFWGDTETVFLPETSRLPEAALHHRRLIIPDTCVDLIIQTVGQTVRCRFCGLDQEPYYSSMATGSCDIFAVRLFFWAVPFLIREEARCVAVPVSSCDAYFPGIERWLSESRFASCSFQEKKEWLEQYLLKCLNPERVPAPLLNSVDFMIRHRGRASVKELAENSALGPRTLERLFKRHLGLSPKKMSDLVRYQVLWRHVLTRRDFQIQDEVYELGFYDQAHLLNTFRRYHGMGLADALACSGVRPPSDAFFQYGPDDFC